MTSFPSRLGSHAELLGRMIRVCGVDPARLSQGHDDNSFTAVARTCMACGHSERCRDWLGQAERQGRQDPPDFCPNAERFCGVQAD